MVVAGPLSPGELESSLGNVCPGGVFVLPICFHFSVMSYAVGANPPAAFTAVGGRFDFFFAVLARPRLLVLRFAKRAELGGALREQREFLSPERRVVFGPAVGADELTALDLVQESLETPGTEYVETGKDPRLLGRLQTHRACLFRDAGTSGRPGNRLWRLKRRRHFPFRPSL